jgi:hypothetical protein
MDGGFLLMYSQKDQLKLEITIAHSTEKLTVQLKVSLYIEKFFFFSHDDLNIYSSRSMVKQLPSD